jgi:integrase
MAGVTTASERAVATLALREPAGAISIDFAIERAKEYARASRSEATRRAYASDLRDFERFCRDRGLVALPATPQTIALYVTELAERVKVSTIRRRLVAIAGEHKRAGFDPAPTSNRIVREILRGIANVKGTAVRRKDALTLDRLQSILLAVAGDDLKSTRVRALILLGFAAALRRSEIAALDVADVRFEPRGLLVLIRKSKTDQTGEGATIAVPYVTTQALCAARALKAWILAASLVDGPLFRSFKPGRRMSDRRIGGRDVANLVHALVARARLEGDFSAHSLRAGFVTAASEARVSIDNIMRTTRHRSLAVLQGYIRRANVFDDPALASIIL